MLCEIMIEVEGISKIYRIYKKPAHRLLQLLPFFSRRGRRAYLEHCALNDISFKLFAGETLAIVGCNGSGKSTLLQIICGTLTPSSGCVQTKGRVVALLELGAGFNPEFTGQENVYLCGQLYGLSKADIAAKFSSIVEFSGIGDKVYQLVNSYSSGMFVRLAFSVIAHLEPQVLIVDEALAVGDFVFQQKCAKYMKDTLCNVAKVLVSHDLAAIAAMADRVMVLHEGRMIYLGDTQTGLAIYQKVARGGDVVQPTEEELISVDVTLDEKNIWQLISNEQISGAGRARIEKFSWCVAGKENYGVVQKGDIVDIYFTLTVMESLYQPMIGYQVQNRFGMVIFGENTHSSNFKMHSLGDGSYQAELSFLWPQVEPGEYGVTLGIGDGMESASHIVECWAHNVIVLGSIQTDPVHGIFNNKLSSFKIGQVV